MQLTYSYHRFVFISYLLVWSLGVARATPGVGDAFMIRDGGQLRRLVVSGQGLAVRPALGSLRMQSFPQPLSAAELRQRMSQLRAAQPDLAEVNFLLEEPAVVSARGAHAAPLILTCRVHVTLEEGVEAATVAAAVGVVQVDAPAYAPGQYVFHCGDAGGALGLMERLRKWPGVRTADAMLARSLRKKFTPNDPLFTYDSSREGYQWHLKNTGQFGGTTGVDLNVSTAWDVAKGAGVTIGIVDDGVQINHPDLAANYLASASWDFRDGDADPSPVDLDDNHGTSVAGLAVAAGNNASGVSGVAPAAKLAALRIDLNAVPDDQTAAALAYKNDVVQIKSNSYGPEDTGYTLDANGPLTEAALLSGVTTGRGGRGTIYTVAAGNGAAQGDNANNDGFANSIYTIAVAGVSDDGKPTYFSEPGAPIVVSALGDSEDDQGITTTDRTGADGYNDGTGLFNYVDQGYTNDFGGTSACAPQAAGVVALMLQVNSTLGWRDVQEILLASATKNDPTDNDWATNANGYSFNHKYGAGLINAAAAVTKAATWTNLGAQATATVANPTLNVAIPDFPSTTGVVTSFNFATQPIRVEHATVSIKLTHPTRGQLGINLISPSGMVSRLMERRDDDTANLEWTFMSVRHWGENSAGTWKVQVLDLVKEEVGTLVSATVKLYGTTATAPSGVPVVAAPAGSTVASATGMIGVPFRYQVTASKAPTAFSTKVALTVGSGLTLDAATGLLSGTPTASTPAAIILKATNAAGISADRTLNLTISTTSTLATGLDLLRPNWVTAGTTSWAINFNNTHDGVDCARPGALTPGDYSYVKTWVEGPVLLRFWWKLTASDLAADTLDFYLDGGSPVATLTGTTPTATTSAYVQQYYFITAGRHSIKWEIDRDVDSTTTTTGYLDEVTLVDPNVSGPVILDQPHAVFAPEGGQTCFNLYVVGQAPLTYQWKKGATAVTPGGTGADLLVRPVPATGSTYTCVITNAINSVTTTGALLTVTPAATAALLANGMDTTDFGFGTNATLGWARQTTVTHDGVDALKSGAIGDSGSSVLQSCILGPAAVSFWWKVSSEEFADSLDFKVDGVTTDYISGAPAWAQVTYDLGSGLHVLEWNYNKDATLTAGADAGYLDGISIIPNGYASWVALTFTTAQQTTAGITGQLDDPDHDGISNLLEYGLRLNPNVNNPSGLPQLTRQGANLEYTYVDDYSRKDVRLTPEVSSNLSTWTPMPATEISLTGDLHTMRLTLPLTTGKQYLRLRATVL